MKAFTQFWDMSKKNKIFAIFVLLICFGAIEFSTGFFSQMPGMIAAESGGQVVAVVQTVATDVRQKPVEEESWYQAEPQSDVIRGDAIYSGKQSHAQVRMQSGGILELGEETLVIFDDVDGVTIPDVARGKVKIKVSGNMKIAISGEVTEFSGSQSELELSASGGQGSVRTLKGKIAVTRRGASVRNLVTGQEMDISAPPGSAPPKIKIPKAGELNSEVRLSKKRQTIAKMIKNVLPAEPAPVAVTEPEVARPQPAVQPIGEKSTEALPETVQADPMSEPELQPEPILEAVTEPLPRPEVPPLGEGPEIAMAIPAPPEPTRAIEALSIQEPTIKIDRIMKVQEVYQRRGKRALVSRVGMKTLKVPVALAWNGAKPGDKVFVQIAKEKNFSKPWAEREASGRNTVIQEWKPGRSFWRISRDRQTWSDAGEVFIKPTIAVAQNPSIVAFKKNVFVLPKGKGPEAQAKLRFQDGGLSKARGWVLQGSETLAFAAQKTRTVYVTEPRIDIPLAKAGKYFFRVRSVASGGEISSFSSPVQVTAVKAVAPPVRIRVIANIDEQKSEVSDELKDDFAGQQSEVARQTSKARSVIREEPVRRYRPWSITLEGGATALVSSEQLATSVEPASVHVLGLRGGYNDGRNSISGAYHSKFGASNAQGSAQSNSRLDGRYTRWWQTKWSWLKLGWAGGLSTYNNSSSPNFSKGYTVAKTGLNVAMSLGDKWKTGGDALIGTWTDANQLYEFGGYLSYDFTTELAFGVGYRVSLFEAGTQSSAPIGLPYREAMGEAYSSLKYAF